MVVIEDSMGNRNTNIHAGPEYHQKGVNVPPPPQLVYLHVLCDILVPMTRVIVVLPLISSITTVPNYPRGILLDSRPAFLQTPIFVFFILLSTDLSVKRRKLRRVHESSAGSRVRPGG